MRMYGMAGLKRWNSKTGNVLELLPSLSSISSVASSEGYDAALLDFYEHSRAARAVVNVLMDTL